MKNKLQRIIRNWTRRLSPGSIPQALAEQIKLDRRGLQEDPGPERAMQIAMAWLCEAQDRSASSDGGVARSYHLMQGWQTSYPETTGYIIPTFIEYANWTDDSEYRVRAQRMLDWLVSIQLSCGGFQGGRIDSNPVVPVVFNTGQILMGLASGETNIGGYGQSLRAAADWLVSIQDPDGCWRQFESPFAAKGEKTYDTHTAWGLLEAARVDPSRGYAEAALANIRWALSHQRENGWFESCCLSDKQRPLTHTLGYALRGILEGFRFSRDESLLTASLKTANGLMSALREDGFLPGRLTADWAPAASWACLTGTAQVAHCWLLLFQETGDTRYQQAALAANKYVRRTLRPQAAPELRGVKGSFPIDGAYSQNELPNWAAKFLVDSLLLELEITQNAPGTATPGAHPNAVAGAVSA